jgi:hypothetical protein
MTRLTCKLLLFLTHLLLASGVVDVEGNKTFDTEKEYILSKLAVVLP